MNPISSCSLTLQHFHLTTCYSLSTCHLITSKEKGEIFWKHNKVDIAHGLTSYSFSFYNKKSSYKHQFVSFVLLISALLGFLHWVGASRHSELSNDDERLKTQFCAKLFIASETIEKDHIIQMAPPLLHCKSLKVLSTTFFDNLAEEFLVFRIQNMPNIADFRTQNVVW